MRDLFTAHSTELVVGLVVILVLMRLILQIAPPLSAVSRWILWWWHGEARAIAFRRFTGVHRARPDQRAADDELLGQIYRQTLPNMDSTLVALALVFFVIRPLVVQAFFVPTSSMQPTLLGDQAGRLEGRNRFRQDRVLVNRYLYFFREPRRQEILVFHAPPAAKQWGDEGDSDFIKRLIGLPGDTVEVRDHHVWINGRPLYEPYLDEDDLRDSVFMGNPNFGPVTVPEGHYLMLGDNRPRSYDARGWNINGEHQPFITRDAIVGKAMCVFWPIHGWRLLRTPAEEAAARGKTTRE